MGDVSIIGLDLAKNVSQAHGAGADGSVLFRCKLSRAQLLKFMAGQPPCVMAMEACANAHQWGRVIGDLGHEVRLIRPACVKPFVKRQKMGWLRPPHTASRCAKGVVVNAPQRRGRQMKDTMIGVDLAKSVFQLHGASMAGHLKFRKKVTRVQFRHFMAKHEPAVVVMEACGSASYRAREMVKLGHEVRLIAPQYVRPFVKRQKNDAADAEAIVVAAQPPRCALPSRNRKISKPVRFISVRVNGFSKERLGRISKAGQTDIRYLLITGAMSRLRVLVRKSIQEGSWLARLLQRKPLMVVAIALANKMARAIWAMITKKEDYRDPARAISA
jgi:transposase